MPYYIAIYDWSLYTLPAAIPMTDIEGDTQAADWLGETFTFNGGSSVQLAINDDDANFEDGYVETGGAQTLSQPVTINGTVYPAGATVENEFSMLDASGNEIWVVRINGVNVGFAYPDGGDPSVNDTFTGTTGRDGDPVDSDDGVGSFEPYSGVICFAPGTLVETPGGPKAVETLKQGDLVATSDHGAQAVLWASRRKHRFERGMEDALPIEIKAGALGAGLPLRRLVVSPQHRFVLERGGEQYFVAAKALTVLKGVRVMRGKKAIEYVHFACANHEVVVAEGAPTESCYLGPVMLDCLTAYERLRLRAAFPGVALDTGDGYGPTARPVLRLRKAKALLRLGELQALDDVNRRDATRKAG